MLPKTETPSEALKDSPQTPQEIATQVNNHLEKLKADVAKEADPAEKKKLVKLCFDQMNKEEREELSKRVEGRQAGIPRELLEDLIGVLDLTDDRKAALRAEIEAGEKKPEGWMAQAGDALKSGTNTVLDWMKSAWKWTEGKAGSGWKGLAEGFTAAVGAIGTGFSWLREKSAHMFGSLAASVDEYLPDWVKKPLNFIMGDYGVLYKNFAKYRIEIVANASDQPLSLEALMEKYRSLSDNDRGGLFDAFCKDVALAARNKRTGPLKVTQAQLEQAADQVVAQRLAMPATPPAAPGVAPVATPGAAPAQAVAAASPQLQTRVEVQSLSVKGINLATEERDGHKLLKLGQQLFSIEASIPLSSLSVSKIELLSDKSVAITGILTIGKSWASVDIPGTSTISNQELERIVGELQGASSKKKITIAYVNEKGQSKTADLELSPVS